MSIQFPKPKISQEQLDKFLKDPEVITLEFLFVTLTLGNVFFLYRILLGVCPFPISVTWFQLLVGFLFAGILGESSREFPRCAFFPTFSLDWKLYEGLAVPTLMYLGMITFANVLLSSIPTVASFPVVVSLAVALHHVSRFIGCGQIYLPIRWISLAIMLVGFFLGIFDPKTMGITVFPIALAYAIFSAIFRAWCLEKAMHVVEGRGNTLHNHQTIMGLMLLPIIALIAGERKVLTHMPSNFHKLFTWQCWGCLVVAGTIPFIKNVIANRMIRRTGQAPWRALEAVSMILVFALGGGIFDSISFIGVIAFILVLGGRILGMLDALAKDPEERRRAIRQDVQHGAFPPSGAARAAYTQLERSNYNPTELFDSFDGDYEAEELLESFNASKSFNMEMSFSVSGAQPLAINPSMYSIPEERTA